MIRSPVFIIGCPRSGTTLLYTLLTEVTTLWSLGSESKAIIEQHHHPRVKGWESGALDATDATPESRTYIRRAFARQAAPGNFWRAVNQGRDRLRGNRLWRAIKQRGRTTAVGAGAAYAAPQTGLRLAQTVAWARYSWQAGRRSIRLLEKTPENCLRLSFLLEIFPDAHFIYLTRDAGPNIASLMEGWRQPYLFPGYAVPDPVRIPGDTRGRWAFTLIPGWRDLLDRPLAEVCAHQWVTCNQAVLDFLATYQGRIPTLTLAYEELLHAPARELERIGRFLNIDTAEITRRAAALPEINVVSTPGEEKWRRIAAELPPLAPLIQPTRQRLGYTP